MLVGKQCNGAVQGGEAFLQLKLLVWGSIRLSQRSCRQYLEMFRTRVTHPIECRVSRDSQNPRREVAFGGIEGWQAPKKFDKHLLYDFFRSVLIAEEIKEPAKLVDAAGDPLGNVSVGIVWIVCVCVGVFGFGLGADGLQVNIKATEETDWPGLGDFVGDLEFSYIGAQLYVKLVF